MSSNSDKSNNTDNESGNGFDIELDEIEQLLENDELNSSLATVEASEEEQIIQPEVNAAEGNDIEDVDVVMVEPEVHKDDTEIDANAKPEIKRAAKEKKQKVKPKKKPNKSGGLGRWIKIISLTSLVAGGGAYLYISGFSPMALIDEGTVNLFDLSGQKSKEQNEIQDKLRQTSETQAQIESEFELLGQEVNKLKTVNSSFEDLQNAVETLSNIVKTQGTKIVELTAENQGLTKKVAALQKKQSNKTNYDDSGLKSQLKKLNKRVSNIDTANENLKNGFNEFKTETLSQLEAVQQLANVAPDVDQISKKVTFDVKHNWKIRGIGKEIAYLYNTTTKQQLRLSVGVDVPHCGPTLLIDAVKKVVKTQSCSFSTN